MARSPIHSSLSSFDRLPRLIAMQFVPGKAPRMLFDGIISSGKPNPGPYFDEIFCEVSSDQTMQFVHELFGPDHPHLYDVMHGRPWAVVEPVHNIIVSVILGNDGFEVGFHRRHPINPTAPNPGMPPESN